MFVKRLLIRVSASLLALVWLGGSVVYAHSLTGHQYLKDANVSLKTARVKALEAYPGRIVSEELEREPGGSGLRYSFDIRNRKQHVTHEVGVDAKTGKLLENSIEGAEAD